MNRLSLRTRLLVLVTIGAAAHLVLAGPPALVAEIGPDEVLGVIDSIGGNTIIVDWAGTGDFDNIQDALDAAEDGDTIIVLPSSGSPEGPTSRA